MANTEVAETQLFDRKGWMVRKEPAVKLPTRTKSLVDLVNSLTQDDKENDALRNKILCAMKLSDGLDQQINSAMFRHVISTYFNVDASFLYKRVFNAFDKTRKGYLTGRELVAAIQIFLHGPFQAHVDLGMRVYGKPIPVNPANDPDVDKIPSGRAIPTSEFFITRVDAITSIVESLQLSSPRARYTLTTDNREKAYHIGEDLVFIIFPKLDIDGDDLVSLDDFTKACYDDPTLVQVFGQFLPRYVEVLPPPPPVEEEIKVSVEDIPSTPVQRPRSAVSLSSFENVNYLTHSPTIGRLWGRADIEPKSKSVDDLKQPNKLAPIPILQKKVKGDL